MIALDKMKEIRSRDGQIVFYVGNIVGPVKFELSRNYTPGENGQPNLEQLDAALRRELSDYLEPGHPIIFTKQK